jgi:hypothetical protein
MVLLKSVIEVATRPMPHMFAELGPDGSGIGVMAVGGDPIRRDASDRLGRSEERLGRREIAVLAQHDVNKCAIAIDRAGFFTSGDVPWPWCLTACSIRQCKH